MNEINIKIHEQITEETWCKGYYAYTKDNNAVHPLNENAVKWCLAGWMYKIYGDTLFDHIKQKIQSIINGYEITWNDKPERTFEEVKELLIKADI